MALHETLLRREGSGKPKISREGHCRMCQRPAVIRKLTRHHLIPLAWFYNGGLAWKPYRNADANIVPVCRPDHDLLHDLRDAPTMMEARRMLRRMLTQREIAFVIELRGKAWFDRWYPR